MTINSDLPDLSQGIELCNIDTEDGNLIVFENKQYRWFTLGGQAIQSLLVKQQPNAIVLPIPIAMLTSLLWQLPDRVLSLGMGGAGFERTLSVLPNCHVTSVEKNQTVIDMAKTYFQLPSGIELYCNDAFSYLEQCNDTFDLVLVDLFSQQLNPDYSRTQLFFKYLQQVSHKKSVVSLNINAHHEQDFTTLLKATSTFFNHMVLVQFNDFKNIIVLLSKSPIPSKDQLIQANVNAPLAINFELAINGSLAVT